MRRYLFSGSAAPRVSRCISSGLFGAVDSSSEAAAIGSAGHEHMALRSALGVDEAMRLLDHTMAKWGLSEKDAGILRARLAKYAFVPPPMSMAELSLAILDDGSAVRISGGRGNYPDAPEETVCPLQIDLVYSEPEPLDMSGPVPRCPKGSVLMVVDYKFGEETKVDPVERNWQLRAAAVAAAAYFGAEQVLPAIAYPGAGDGDWDYPEAPFVAKDLVADVEFLRGLRDRRAQALAAIESGEPPTNLHEGWWCDHCPSIDSCPAKLALVRAAIEVGPNAAHAGLDPNQARVLVSAYRAAQRFVERAKDALERYTRIHEEPIDVGDGVFWGPTIQETTEIDAGAALDVLRTELSEENALSTLRMSKAAIENAIRDEHEANGVQRQKAAAFRRIMAKLHEAGAVEKVRRVEFRWYRKGTELEAPGGDLERQLRAAAEPQAVDPGPDLPDGDVTEEYEGKEPAR